MTKRYEGVNLFYNKLPANIIYNILDVGNTHAYYNKSNEDRYHIIIHGNYKSNSKWKKLVENSYKKNGIK